MLIDTFVDSIKDHINFDDVKVILDLGTRDLGQTIELHSIFPKAKIYAFEANKLSYDYCLTIKPDYCELFYGAVMDYNGEIQFYRPPQSENHGASSIFEPTVNVVGVPYVTKTTVPCRRIDTWAKENKVDKIDLVWADVQGAELPVFKSFGKLLDGVKAIATEVETGMLYYESSKYQPSQYEEIKKFLGSKGFSEVSYVQPWELEADVVFCRLK